MEPPAIKELEKLPAHKQVVEQIRHIYSTIRRDLDIAEVAPSTCFTLKYEHLCRDPEKEMERLDQFFRANKCKIPRLHGPPKPFAQRDEVRIDRELFENVKKYAQKP